jgi:hypothetical protein
MAIMIPETVNDEIARVVRRREMDEYAAAVETAKSTSILITTAPTVNHAAPREKDSSMNAVVEVGATAARDNFRSVVATIEGPAIDAR